MALAALCCTGCNTSAPATTNSTTPTATTTTLTASSSTIATGASVTFTATVSPAAAAGTITFYDGTASLGAGTLSSGVATLATTALTAVGTHSITAVYGGSTGYDGSTSSALSVTVTAAPSFTLAPSAPAVSITQGGSSATDTITLTGVNGFSDSVNLTVSGVPTGVVAVFAANATASSSVLTLTAGSTAAVGGPVTVTVTGVSGSLTASTTFALTVTAAPVGSFSLTPSAPSLSVTQGNIATSTINIVDVSPFSGSVTLSASGLPTGVSAAFATNPATSSSVVTFTAIASAAAGSSTVTITGVSGSLTETTTIALTVNATGSFSLAPSAPSLSVTQGANGPSTITVTDVSPFSGSVTLTASGLPTGVSAAFATNPATSSSVLTLTALGTAATGTSTVTIKGVSGSLNASTTLSLTVTAPAAPNDGIPLPAGGVATPGVASGPITILNWAGFTAAESWTFDDSQPSQIEHFAEVQAVGVPVTYYITSGEYLDDADYNATWSEAATDGDELGNHTRDHCQANLTNCLTSPNTGNLATELDDATAYILANYPQSAVWTGASPYGDTGYDADASTRFLVYRGIYEGSMLPNDSTDSFNLWCHLAAQGETAAQFNARTDTARGNGAWQIFLIHTMTPTSAIWYNPVAVTDVTGAMTYANTTGDTWVDSVVDVAAYWRGLKTLAAVKPVTSGTTKTWSWTLPAHFPTGKFLRVTIPSGTLLQNGIPITENAAGFYSVSLDAGSLTLTQ